jgi:hypothetical protein
MEKYPCRSKNFEAQRYLYIKISAVLRVTVVLPPQSYGSVPFAQEREAERSPQFSVKSVSTDMISHAQHNIYM